MNVKNKGKLIEAYVDCSQTLISTRKSVEALTAQQEKLASLISLDNDLSELIIAGGISTIGDNLVVLNRETNQLEIKSCIASYNIKSSLTAEQIEVLENDK